ncbi:MAG: hypothetical protein J6R47_01070 [Acholeplasmatales bacterium]|nr:hypothetical protein [Acholeplasmatales bacterium]
MIPGIHYSENEKYESTSKYKCPHCGHEHKVDIGFYKECLNCHRSMQRKISVADYRKKRGF